MTTSATLPPETRERSAGEPPAGAGDAPGRAHAPLGVLDEVFGYAAFRGQQAEIIDRTCAGRHQHQRIAAASASPSSSAR